MIKTFGDKKITIRSIQKSDLKIVKKFQEFVNSLIKEDVKITLSKPVGLKEEREFLKDILKSKRRRTRVFIFAECDGEIVATTGVEQLKGKQNYIGRFGIIIRNGYRGFGLGKYITAEIIRLATRDLRPKPKMIKLEVYANNVPAIGLYKKMGFRMVARIPKQFQHKGKLVDEFIMLKKL